MQAIGVIGLTMADVNLFPKPPRRPSGPSRRRQGGHAARLARAVARFIDSGVRDDRARNPRVSRYPY